MKNTARALALALLTLVGAVAVAGSSDVLLDALLQRPRAESGAVVVPDRFVRAWDPITVFLPSARGPREGGAESDPARFVSLDPDWPGAWAWLDARTLQFRPAEPYPPLEVLNVEVAGGGTTSLATLMAPPLRSVPSNGARDLAPVEQVALTFARPIAPAALARMVTIELRPLPGIDDGPSRRLGPRDFEVKVLDRREPRDPYQVTLVLNHPIPLGHRATVRFGLSLDDRDEAVSTLTFDTAQPFRVATLGCPGQAVPIGPEGVRFTSDSPLRCGGSREVHVTFTARPAALGPVEGRNLVRFEPAVEGLAWRVRGRSLVVTGEFQPELPYRVSVAPAALQDEAGRALELRGEGAVYLYFPQREAYLNAKAGHGVIERFGPQRVPLEGRGHASVDLRIHRVDPLNRNLWPFPDRPVAIDESRRPPGPGEEPSDYTNGGTSGFGPIPASQLASRLQALGSPGISEIVELPVAPDAGAATYGLNIEPQLTRLNGSGAPGHYLVGVRRLDGGTSRSWMRVQVTDLSLSTVEGPNSVVFAVNSLASAGPVQGATVRVEGVRTVGGSSSWEPLFEGRTDGDGLLTWQAPGEKKRTTVAVRRLVVEKGTDVLVLEPRTEEAFRDGHWHRNRRGWLDWAHSALTNRGEQPQLLGHLFPERPVYRPGDPVHLKGFVRRKVSGRLRVPRLSGKIVVRDPSGKNHELPVQVSEAGGVYAKWEAEEPPTGSYHAQLFVMDDKKQHRVADARFQVEAYRLPTFEVQLHPPEGRTEVPNDRPFDVTMTASYYAGGRVAGQPVRWRVTQYPYSWVPRPQGIRGAEGFHWSSDGRYGRGGRFRATPSIAASAMTTRTGEATIDLDPGIEADARPRTYVVEATVTGADDQTVTETLSVHAVPAFVLGLKVPRHVESARSIPARLAVVDPQGAPLAGKELTVRLVQRQWHSVLQASDFSNGEARYLTDVVEVPVREQVVTSGAEPIELGLPIDEAGVYIVELEARDELGRVQVVRVDLFASGSEPVAWDKPKAGMFELTPDQDRYEPGDRARILVRSPYQRGDAIVVVETPTGLRTSHVPVRGGSATVTLAIEEGWVPRIPVHVLLRRGRTEAARGGGDGTLDLGKPETVASTRWLTIDPVENQLQVEVSHPERALPGQAIDVAVKLSDPDGRPLAGEATLWLVDQAVLALGREQRLDPLPDFLPDRSSFVWLRDTRSLTFGRLPVVPMPGGDGYEEDEEGLLERATIRKDFRPIAHYEPSLRIGPSGRATVRVQLPDNLTVFKVRAKAVAGPTRFGVATSQVAVRLPVVVQPALPRFVRPGDRFDAAAVVRVVEGDGGPGSVELGAEGLVLAGDPTQSITLDPSLATTVRFPVEVGTPEVGPGGRLARDAVTVTGGASRRSDGATDAAETVLPLRDDRFPRFTRRLLTLEPGASEAIDAISERARPGTVRRLVVAADHAGLVKLASGLDVLRRTRFRNTGEGLAQARALLGLEALREPLGLGSGEESAEVAATVQELLAWLPTTLDRGGRVAQWPGGTGRVTLTAEALTFLVEAREAGHAVPGPLMDTLIRTLQGALRSDYGHFIDGERWYERTRALWGLTNIGRFDDAYFNELARASRNLGPQGAAHIVLAAARGGALPGARERGLVQRLSSEITVQLYQGQERYAGLKSKRTDRNPIIVPSEAQALAQIVEALQRAEPSDGKLGVAVDALVRLGQDDGWGYPEVDAAALFALKAQLAEVPGANGQLVVEAASGSTTLALQPGMPVASVASTQPGKLTLRHAGGRAVHVLVLDRWTPLADGSAQAAEQRGFVVSRSWLRVREGGPPDRVELTEAAMDLRLPVGGIVEEHVQVVNPEARHHVIVTVPLAAGMELLNPALATAPPEARPANRTTAAPSWVAYYDDAVSYAFETLPKGTVDFYFRTRATVRGAFVQPQARAEMIYDRTVVGASPGAKVRVEDPSTE